MKLLILIPLILVGCMTPEKPNTPAPTPIDQTAISKTIASHKKYLSHCYGKAIMEKGGAHLTGTVLINFKVGPDGRAQQPRMIPEQSNLQNKNLNHCLFAGITSWDFPVHPEGKELDISYPFHFKNPPPAGMQKTLDRFEKLRHKK